jgi:folate-binding protein YgfZ
MSTSYDAARTTAAFVNRNDRVRMLFTGAKAGETLNGLLTNDIARLVPGMGCYAAALTNKGKVVADVRVFAREDGRFIVDTSPAAGPGFVALIRKYVNPRLAQYRDISAEYGDVTTVGPATAGDAVPQVPYASVAAPDGGLVARIPDLGVSATAIIAPREFLEGRILSLRAEMPEMDATTAEVMRIEAGRPLWGPDMDENTLAQEAALDRADLNAISFDKGCYTGQETVARVHFRGHVNRTLRGLRADAALTSGATLHGPDGAEVGNVRSTAVSPRLGAIALAYVRREIEDGTAITVRAGNEERQATVVALPFV